MHVSTVRLLILGMLGRGPMHGHRVRREIEVRDLEQWAGIQSGALYGTLRRLEQEELVAPVRTEQRGRYPARTVYELTPEGRRELATLLERALGDRELRLGPADIALLFGDQLPGEELAALLREREARLGATLEEVAAERERKTALGYLGPIEIALMRHVELRLEAELRWHRELAATGKEDHDGQRHAKRQEERAPHAGGDGDR